MKKFIRQHMSISILKQNIEVFYNSAIKVTLYLYWNFHIFKKLSNELSVNIESPINLLSGKEFTFSNKRPGNSLPFPDGQIDTIPSSQLQASNHQQVWKCTSSPPKRIQQVCAGMHLLSHPWGSSSLDLPIRGSSDLPKPIPAFCLTDQVTNYLLPQNRPSTRLKINKKTLSPVRNMTPDDFASCHRDYKRN